MSMKFDRTANPRSVTEANCTTPQARQAFEDVHAAINEFERLEDTIIAGTNKAAREQAEHKSALAGTIRAGGNPAKVKHPTPFDPTPHRAQQEAWTQQGQAAASRLRDALRDNLPADIQATITAIENLEPEVRATLAAVEKVLTEHNKLTRRLGWLRGFERFPRDIPPGDQTPRLTVDLNAAYDLLRSWRITDLESQLETLIRREAEAARNGDNIDTIATQIREIEDSLGTVRTGGFE